MHPILEKIYDMLPSDKKHRNNGWIYFNAQGCCENFGHEHQDKKHRGNITFTDDSFTYNCFNCHYTCGFSLGQYFSKKTIQWLKWICPSTKDFNDLLLMVREYNESENPAKPVEHTIVKKREIRTIPTNYKCIQDSLYNGEKSKTLMNIVNYIYQRNPRLLTWSKLYWAENQNNFLIPCYEYNEVVGYSLRSLDDSSASKYIHYIPQGYVFNYDNLLKNRKYEILVEGQTDALAINGTAYLSSTFTPERLKRILPFTKDKEIIICPDRDKAGQKIVNQVLENDLPFSISFPNWEKGIKDVEEAVKKYGRLYTIYSIITSKEEDKKLIKMKSMKWFS